MSWIAVPVPHEEVTAESLFDLAKKHRLIPENVVDAVDYYRGISACCALIQIEVEGTGENVGSLIVSDIRDGDSAQIDFIPRPQFFSPVLKDGSRNEEDFLGMFDSAVRPVFDKLLAGRDLHRLTAMVPKSRSRTVKALKACGFRKEGVMRDAIKFSSKDVEDLVVMGMLPSKE
jgi:RimJ/RimL family protein N-acetyltransferase